MSWALPWWLRPWHAYRAGRSYGMELQRRIDDLCETARMDIATIGTLESQRQALTARNAELQRQLGIASGTLDENGRPTTTGRALLGYEQAGSARPEFVIVGLDRGTAGGKRIYVSRELGGASFGLSGASPTWNLRCSMGNMLVIDKPGYGAAMEQMAATWRNWDADQASQHRPVTTAALPEGSDPRD